jgi:hypothetical protein
MRGHLLIFAVMLLLGGAAEADNEGSGDLFDKNRMSVALKDLTRVVRGACNSGSSEQSQKCTIERVTEVMPHGSEMSPYCADVSDFADRYFCVLMGALALDLVSQSGAVSVESFLEEHGRDGVRTINEAGALLVEFLASKCSGGAIPGCGPKEAAVRLGSSPKEIAECAVLTDDRVQVTCLMTSRAVGTLRQAQAKL